MSDNFVVQTAVSHPFASETTGYAGVARIPDLQGSEWERAFSECESFSDRLLESSSEWMSPDYPWRLDPLHCWSRIWEYPFALTGLASLHSDVPLTVIDVGPGANFYLPLLEQLGHHVYGVDMDPAVVRAGQRLADFVRAGHGFADGSLNYVVGDALHLPFKDGQADVVQSLSVLEHILEAHTIVPELARVLAPSGALLLTLDLALHGSDGLNVEELQSLLDVVAQHFEMPSEEAKDVFASALEDSDTLTNFTSPRSIRAEERCGSAHPKREVDHWPPISHGPLRPRSIPRAHSQARSRNQPLMAVYAVKARKKGFGITK